MSNTVTQIVPVLDGTNWPSWSERMQDFLRSQGLWSIVSGDVKAPRESDYGDAHIQFYDAQRKFMDQSEQSMGYIRLRLAPGVRTKIADQKHSSTLWVKLTELYG